jgi:hypothetical protein
VIVLFPDFDPPPGWASRTDRGLMQLAPPDVEAALLLVFAAVGGATPAAWVESLLGSEVRGGFLVLDKTQREITSAGGLPGTLVEVRGGFKQPDALVERRAYAVFVDGKALYPFALHASEATFDQVVGPFMAAVRSVRRRAES